MILFKLAALHFVDLLSKKNFFYIFMVDLVINGQYTFNIQVQNYFSP